MWLIFIILEPDDGLRARNEDLNEDEGQNAEEDEDGGEGEADGRHVIAHPNLMHHMEWELNKLLPILRREQAVGRLHGIGQTALLVLEKFSRLRDFKPYFPPGLGHAGRLAYVWP